MSSVAIFNLAYISFSVLPQPAKGFTDEYAYHPPTVSTQITVRSTVVRPYGQRKGWVPRTIDDFGDGGAYPEVHITQYPLEMGRKETGSTQKTVAVQIDSDGKIKFDALIAPPSSNRKVFAKYDDMAITKVDENELARPDQETEAQISARTKAALEKVVSGKITGEKATNVSEKAQGGSATFIKYTPSQNGTGINSGIEHRIIRLTEMPIDPLEPPKFKIKKAPKGPPSPPATVMHSPPRKLTAKDQQDWKIPPCISNWKNNKGYTIPLDKRLAADGRGLQEVVINDNFAKLSESLYIAERNAREEVAKRAEVEKRLKLKEKEKKEEMLRKLAQEARLQRTATQLTSNEDDVEEESRRERDKIRHERNRERERDLRMSRNKSQATRNADRDVSEKIALGQAVAQPSAETLYDQRLFNQSEGLASGFGEEDSYTVYSKPLFAPSSANALYKPKKGDGDAYGTEEDLKKLQDTTKFRPDKEFSGIDRSKPTERSGPVEFEKEEDPFGLDAFLSQAKGTAKPLDKIGKGGHMGVSSASIEGARSGGSKRGRIDFEPTKDKGGDPKKSKG